MEAINRKTVYALGFFDGVHIGHQSLLQTCRELAESLHCKAGAVTFIQHPDALVLGKAPKLLYPVKERRGLLSRYGMEQVVELVFDKALQAMPWQDFIRLLAEQYGAAGFVCGADFRFGHKGQGTAESLQEYCRQAGFACRVVPQKIVDGTTVSSTHIRTLVEAGQMEAVSTLLGRPYAITGPVQTGRQLGRDLGMPTANLHFEAGAVLPKFGVYACRALAEGQWYDGVCNIGARPTVAGEGITLECHLLDFDRDVYGKTVTVCLFSLLRPEKKFESLLSLKNQMENDVLSAKKVLKNKIFLYNGENL